MGNQRRGVDDEQREQRSIALGLQDDKHTQHNLHDNQELINHTGADAVIVTRMEIMAHSQHTHQQHKDDGQGDHEREGGEVGQRVDARNRQQIVCMLCQSVGIDQIATHKPIRERQTHE